jgi:hypothetical protein
MPIWTHPHCILHRTQLTTVDQETAVVGKEPLETLHTFRTGAGLGWAEAAGALPVHVEMQDATPHSCRSAEGYSMLASVLCMT